MKYSIKHELPHFSVLERAQRQSDRLLIQSALW